MQKETKSSKKTMTTSLSSKIEFKKLCNLFERIFKSKGYEKYAHLQKFTRECRDVASKIKAQDPNADISLFPIFRLILPNLERERGPYGLKAKNLGSLYSKVFPIGPDKAKQLISHRPIAGCPINADFADRIEHLVGNQLRTESNLTIHNINKFLDDVSNSSETNKSKYEIFSHLPRLVTRNELKWLTRILLKDLRLGIQQKRVLEVIHPNAESLFNVSSDLLKVCNEFSDLSSVTHKTVQIEIFSHIKPMLLERLEVKDFGKLFVEKQQYYVQPKFDGERSQLHMKDGKFKYFTRQGFDITNNASYGEFADSGGFLTSKIAALLDKSCTSIILDGELMGWHKTKKKFGSKGQNFDVKKLSDSSQHQPCFVAFDILLYNDKLLINKPYSERLEYLNSAFMEKEGILSRSEINKVSNVDDILKLFNKSLDKNEEGIVIKKCDVTYKPNSRIKSGCYKTKAEYSKDLITDLDLIILGGYYGDGRCSGKISSFLVGVASPPTNKNNLPSEFWAVSGVRSGLSDEDIEKIQLQLKTHWQSSKPPGVLGPRKGQVPSLWVAPKNSLVLQLRASEVQTSSTYPIGYTLRFPRVSQIRYDKSWFDTCTKTEFMTLIKNKDPIQKLTKRKATSADVDKVESDEEKPKIRKVAAGPSVHDDLVAIKNADVPRLSRLLEGIEIYVLNGDDELDKRQIEIILHQHMAKVVSNPGSNTFCVIAGNPNTLRATNIISSNKYDVVKPSWLIRATQPQNLGKLQEFYPWELLATRFSTERKLDESYDKFYDSYTKGTTKEDLIRSLERAGELMDRNCEFPISAMKKLDTTLFEEGYSTISMFRGTKGYFLDETLMDVEMCIFKYMGGIVMDSINEDVEYVFTNDEVSEEFLQQFKETGKKIVNSKWIGECFEHRKLLPIESFTL